MSRSTRRIAGVALAGACVAALAVPALAAPTLPDASKAPGKTQIDIQILSFNDFHGNLETPSGSSARVVTGHFVDVNDSACGLQPKQMLAPGLRRDDEQRQLRTARLRGSPS